MTDVGTEVQKTQEDLQPAPLVASDAIGSRRLFQRAYDAQVRLAKADRRPVTAGVQAVATNVLQVFGVLTLAAIVARTLGPEGKGGYDLFIASTQLLQTALGFSLASGVIYTVATTQLHVGLLLRALAIFSIAEGVVAAVAVYACQRLGWSGLLLPPGLPVAAVLLGANVAVLGLSTVSRSVLIGARRFVAANTGDLLKQVLGIVAALAAVLAARHWHLSLLYGLLLANVMTIAVTALIYGRLCKLGVASTGSSNGFRPSFRFALPCFFSNLAQFLNYRMDVFFVNAFHGQREVGMYMAAVLLAQAVNLIPSATQSVLFPTVAAAGSHEASAYATAQANRLLTGLSVLGACALAAISPILLPLAFGAQFQPSVLLLLLLLPGCTAFATTNVLAGYFLGVGRPRLNLIASLAGLGATIVLDLALIPRFAARGAAVASTLSYLITTVVSIWFFTRVSGLPALRLYRLQRADLDLVLDYIKRRRARAVATGGEA